MCTHIRVEGSSGGGRQLVATMVKSQGDWGPTPSVEQATHKTQWTEGYVH